MNKLEPVGEKVSGMKNVMTTIISNNIRENFQGHITQCSQHNRKKIIANGEQR